MGDPMSDARLLTAEDILAPGYKRGELWDGVFVVREPSGGWSSAVEQRISATLIRAGVDADGWLFAANQGYFVARNPDRVLSPDVSFVFRERMSRPPSRGFIEDRPDFVVEVRSPTDSWIGVIEKGGVWIGHGVPVVWCVDPDKAVVAELRPGQEPILRGLRDTASARPILDVEIEIQEVFRGLEPTP